MTLRTGSGRTDSLNTSTGVSPALSSITLAVTLALPQLGLHRSNYLAAAEPQARTSDRSNKSPTVIERDNDGRPVREICHTEGWTDHLDPDTGVRRYRDVTEASGVYRLAYDDYGTLCPPFRIDGTTLHDRSEEFYIRDVAERFQTPESIARYLQTYFEYTHDTPDPKNPREIGTAEKYGDYWQTPRESLVRTAKGKYLGDCDDLAFLAQAILREQGKLPLVMDLGTHAVCVWMESSTAGFCAHSLCTFGYDRNGALAPDSSPPNFFATKTEALQSLMRKYEKKGTGVDKGFSFVVQEDLPVMAIPSTGTNLRYKVPQEALVDPILYSDIRKYEGAALSGSSALYRDLTNRHPSVPTFQVALIKALRSDGVDWRSDEFGRAFHALCELRPHVPQFHEDAALHNLDLGRSTKAIHHYLQAIKAGSNDSRVLSQLGILTGALGDYIRECGADILSECLPALRSAVGDHGYLKDHVAFVRSCACALGKPEEVLPLLEARAQSHARVMQDISAAFSLYRRGKDDYAAALVDLMREQVALGMIPDATSTFDRIVNLRGARSSMRDALPSLRHLPYREDTVILYRKMLEHCHGWSGGHMELVEYMYTAGKIDAAIAELRQAISTSYDIPMLFRDLESMPALNDHAEWPELLKAIYNRKYRIQGSSK